MWIRIAVVLLLSVAWAQGLSAQRLTGTLLDSQSGKPLDTGTLTLLNGDGAELERANTDSAGVFSLDAPGAGSYRLRAERLGYHTVTSPTIKVGERDTLDIEFRISTQVVMLDPIVVRAKPRRSPLLRDFDRRVQQRSFGNFITREDVERQHPVQTTQMLNSIAGVRTVPMAMGARNAVLVRGNCSPSVWIDGVRVQLMGQSIDDLVQPLDLEGIEVYKSPAEAPVQYGGLRAGCAVILIWTRHD